MSFRTRGVGAIIAAGALVAAVGFVSPASAAPNNNSVKQLTKAVTLEGVVDHLEAFQAIADQYGDRAAGRDGYQASVDYVAAELTAAGYTPVVQEFEFPYFEENSELVRAVPATTWVDGRDFLRAQFPTGVPEGTATGVVVPVDFAIPPVPDSPAGAGGTSGCTAADFAGFTAGAIALVQRGGCGFAVKALNAQAAGASAVIVANDGRAGLVGMIGDAPGLTIPAIFVTTEVGLDLASTPTATVTVTVDFTRRGPHGLQRARRDRDRQRREHGHGRSSPGQRAGRRRDQRQRHRQRRLAGDRDPDGQGEAKQHGAVRLVGR